MIRQLATSALLVLAVSSTVLAQTPEERAARIAKLLGSGKSGKAQVISELEKAPPLERWKTLRILDRDKDTTVRKVHDALDANARTKLFGLVDQAGAAATAAGVQQLGIVSDVDDTAVPTNHTPDGPYTLAGSGDFYRLLQRGTDGKGDPGNLHYVSARVPALWPNTRERLEAAGVPTGTFDGNPSFTSFAFGGEDAIQKSKIANLDLWFRLHPGQRFVLLGDSLQRDPEVYRWALANHRDQIELVLIHRAGGPDRNPADYAGEIFFDDYSEATKIVKARGIPQPGALLPKKAPDLAKLPLPDTKSDVEKHGFFAGVVNFFKENVASIWKKPPASTGLAGALGTP
jgi:hypothetical protein